MFLTTCVLMLCAVVWAEDQPIARTPLGDLKGYFLETRGGKQIAAFTSIPYAKPPVNDLRFKAPQPVEAWEGTLDATQTSPVCVQRNPYTRQKEVVGQEDCLYLNIYTPLTGNEINGDRLLPVMVFIHGGGWMCGDATTQMYGPQYLLDRDVILVAMNYRLGPLGFLSTQDEHCPGNNGLKDQQEALRFIQKTIHSFGGDKDSVTIFGESAGGASVHYHMLSKTSVGLFHKGISESGTALVPWAEAPPGEALRNAFRLAKFLDCPQAPSEVMLDCLRTRDSHDIINTEFKFYEWDYEPMTPFKAVAEPDLPGAFLTASPRKTPSIAAVPWMTGLTKDEGCLKSVWITANSSRYREFISAFEAIAPVTFYYDNSPYADVITDRIKDVYFNGGGQEAIKAGILEIYTDSYFAYPALEAIELTFNYTKNPVFLYELTYRATNSFSQIFGDEEGDYGICHADELMHLFPIDFLSKPFSEEDRRISELIITMWTNFATTGDPNKPNKLPFKWEPASSSKRMEYLEIGSDQKMRNHLASRSRIWGSLPLWHTMRTRKFIDEL
ncbi:Venom carboxylesterase-6 [Papilio machaon]|uniref:Carboxylic ester hydrolase n=1 Tax=Papilio machaon TaxID=76193 RepID=A0A194QUW0_PAPMA|nr:Venom carboxylesterase-6 [Papilio machaon]